MIQSGEERTILIYKLWSMEEKGYRSLTQDLVPGPWKQTSVNSRQVFYKKFGLMASPFHNVHSEVRFCSLGPLL